MNIFGIEINGQNVALAFTIVFLVFVILNGFVGFLRGTKKSIFYLIVSAVVFGLGFGLMMILINALLKMQLGKLVGGLVSSVYPEVSATSTAEDIILGIILNFFPKLGQAFEAGSVSASFAMGLVSFVIKLVYILILLILAFTLFKIIADIIWLIIRPKKKDGIRPKKTFGGRMLGFGIGAFKGAVYSLLIFTLIAGVASVASSAMAVADSANENNTESVLVLTDGHATLITLDSEEGNNSSNSLFGDLDLDFVSSIVGAYRKSVPGSLFGAVKISTVPMDEFLFDGVFSFDVQVGDEKVKVKLRQEVEKVANAVAKVAEQFDIQNVSLEALLNIGEEGSEALKGLVDAISDLSLLKVAIPVGLEIGMYSDYLVDENGNKIMAGLFTPEQIPQLSSAVLSDVKSIGYSLVDARKVIAVFAGEGEKDINTYLNLDPSVVQMLFDEEHLGGLSSIDILAPVGITYLTTIEGIKQSIEEFGLSIEEITAMPDDATWSGEIAKLGDVYVALQNLLKDPETGRVFIDKDNYTAILDLFTEEKINNFVDVLFTSNVVNNSAGALVTFAREKLLPDNYKQYITIGDGIKFDADECKAFLNAATCLVQSGFLNMIGSEGVDFNEIIEKLNVDDLARYLSQSNIVRSSLSNSLDLILSNLSTDEMNLRFGSFADWDDQASTEVELRSVLKAMKLLAKNLFNEAGENQGFSINSLKGLTEAELESILSSQIMRGTIVNFLVDNSDEGETLSVIGKGVEKVNAKPDTWYDQFLILEEATLVENNLNITSTNKDIDEEYLVDHYLIYCNDAYLTSVRVVAGEDASVDLSKVITGKDGEGKDLYHVPSPSREYKAYGVNLRRMGVEKFTLTGSNLSINPAYLDLDNLNHVNKFNVYADGELIYSIRVNEIAPLNIDLSTIQVGEDEEHNPIYFEVKEDTKIEVYGYNEGELRKIFNAILSITSKLGDEDLDFSNTDSLTSILSKVDDKDVDNITTSVVINCALIDAIEDLSKQESPFIFIPMELKDGEGNLDYDKWQETNESANILGAVRTIFDGGSFNADNLKIKSIIDNKDKILKSLVICETIKQNIIKIDGIDIPNGEGLSNSSLEGWANSYDVNGNVTSRGELDAMLNAITKVIVIDDNTSINNISTDNLKLKSIIDNRDEILKSLVIAETIRAKLLTVDGINVPYGEELSSGDLTGWKNTYNVDGSVASRGELSYILNAINYVLTLTDASTINDISTDSIKIKSVIDNRDEILKSLVISETIRVKLLEIDGINIPENENLSEFGLDGWKNTYNNDGSVATRAELSALLNAVNYVIAIDENTQINNISTEAIKLKPIIDNRDEILKSLVISETIRTKLLAVEGIDVPSDEGLSETDLEGWKNEYNESGNVTKRAELAALLVAVNRILEVDEDTTVNNINTDSIKLKNVIIYADDVLRSKVISETIRKKLLEVEGINIPSGEGLSSVGLEGWKSEYDDEGNVTSRKELYALLQAVDIILNINDETTINNINTDSIKLKPVVDNKDEILKSKVISETIRTKLLAVEGIDVPENEGLSTTNLTGWKSEYNNDGSVASSAELARLLTSVGLVLDMDEDTTINNIDTDTIKLKQVIEQRDEILKSLVICGTIKAKLLEIDDIEIPADEGLSTTDLEGWKNIYKVDGTVDVHGELSKMLYSIKFIITVDDDTTISSINTNSIKLKALIENDDEVLKSCVMTNTIKTKLLAPSTGITVPSGEGLSTTNLEGWKNIYNGAEEVTSHGEVSSMLRSINYILDLDDDTSINTINVSVIKLKRIITNRDNILRSVAITNTIKDKLLAVEGINIPENEGLGEDTLVGWKNYYNPSTEALETNGEISHILSAIDKALEIDDDTTLDSVNTDDIKVKKLITYRDEILLSLVLADTIRVKLKAIGGVSIPINDGISNDDLTGWKNIYDDEVLVSHGEISRLLAAIDIMFEPNDETKIDTLNVDTITLKHIIDNSDDILKSLVLADTIRVKVCANTTGVNIPTDAGLSSTSLSGWKNTYNSDEYAIEYGELNYLLKAIDEILHPDDETKLNNIVVSIKLGNIIDGKTIILHSKVISETIKTKIVEASSTGTLKLPKDYLVNESPNYISWNNTYNDTYNALLHTITYEVDALGELDYLLSSVDDLLNPADRDKEFSAIGALDYAKLFDPLSQRDIVSSKIISETIINRLEGIAELSIPNSTHVNLKDLSDRSDWWDLDSGEIIYFLNSVGAILTPEQKSSLDSFNLDINTIYSTLTNEESRNTLLKSYIISDTLRVNFMNLDALSSVPTIAHAGVDLVNDLDAWYLISADRSTVSHKELWNLIASIKLLLGNDFDDARSFTLDDLLNNPAFIPALDANKVNTNQTIHTFLQSKMIEEVFVGLASNILTGEGVMADYINTPYGGFVWYEYVYTSTYLEDDRYEYDLQTVLESLYQMENAGLGYSTFAGSAASIVNAMQTVNRSKLADAFVISRTFRGSIAKTFNGIFESAYTAAYAYGMYNGTPIDAWDDVKFVQTDYDAPVSKAVASELLKNNIDTVINNINSVY